MEGRDPGKVLEWGSNKEGEETQGGDGAQGKPSDTDEEEMQVSLFLQRLCSCQEALPLPFVCKHLPPSPSLPPPLCAVKG